MLTAADVMTTDVVTVGPETSVRDIARLLHTKRISGVPVVSPDNRVIGIVSEGDLIGHAQIVGEPRRSWWLRLFDDENTLAREYAKTHARVAQDVMTSTVITVTRTASTLEHHRIKRVPVVRNGKLVGIVTRSNLLQALAAADVSKPASLDDRTIRERLLKELNAQPWAHMLTKNIVVQDGVVHLWGLVQTKEERHALRVAAENTPGAKSVEDHLRQHRVPVAGE
jgi:CBS-domain-containing membrane protein